MKLFEQINGNNFKLKKSLLELNSSYNEAINIVKQYIQNGSKGDLNLKKMKLNELPKISADFNVSGNFICSYNELNTNLVGSPKSVGRNFDCSNNQLKSLYGASKNVNGNFYCSYNELESLEGCPKYVGGDFWCVNNHPIKFTEEQVRAVCSVKGRIHV